MCSGTGTGRARSKEQQLQKQYDRELNQPTGYTLSTDTHKKLYASILRDKEYSELRQFVNGSNGGINFIISQKNGSVREDDRSGRLGRSEQMIIVDGNTVRTLRSNGKFTDKDFETAREAITHANNILKKTKKG